MGFFGLQITKTKFELADTKREFIVSRIQTQKWLKQQESEP